MKPIDIGPGYDKLGEAMREEGLKEVRFYSAMDQFGVTLRDGKTGHGKTIRAAIENATQERNAA